ncbi:hypothetical protein [Chitinophaga sp. RAB17]|uniref:hypothetical protein n=1 Tax=Chitinophaga sp. RAB17 TaxID=3233049 RepID=UPI003F92C074
MIKYSLLLILSFTAIGVKAQSTLNKTATGLNVQTKQLVIGNNSATVNGALINKDQGKTAFSEVGKDFQFSSLVIFQDGFYFFHFLQLNKSKVGKT